MNSEGQGIDFLLARGLEDLRAKILGHQGGWGLGKETNWSLDQSAGDLVFSFAEGWMAQAPAQIIGSLDTSDGTWLWAWANPSIEVALTRDALTLKAFGQDNGIELLTEPEIYLSEERAWSLTGLSVYLNNSQGAYRGVMGTTLVFITFGTVRLSKRQGA